MPAETTIGVSWEAKSRLFALKRTMEAEAINKARAEGHPAGKVTYDDVIGRLLDQKRGE